MNYDEPLTINRKTDALIVVDVQNDFCDDYRNAALAVPEGSRVVRPINRLMEQFDVITQTRDWHEDPGDHFSDNPNYRDSFPVHCVVGTWGAELHPNLDNVDGLSVFFKGHNSAAFSGFEGKNTNGVSLEDYLRQRNIKRVFVVGLAYDFCVKATAIDAAGLGFKTFVVQDACRAVNKSEMYETKHPNARNDILEAGVIILHSYKSLIGEH